MEAVNSTKTIFMKTIIEGKGGKIHSTISNLALKMCSKKQILKQNLKEIDGRGRHEKVWRQGKM